MSRITPHQIAMGVGAAGAMVDVSSYVGFMAGISQSWGRQDEFRDVNPRAFSFTLDNYDGRFTPGNTASAWPTPVVEGMPVSWLLGTRLVSGTVLGVALGADEPNWGTITIMCDDMLGNAARRQVSGLADGAVRAATPYAYWPLTDSANSAAALESSGNSQPPLSSSSGANGQSLYPIFGATGVPAVGASQLEMDGPTATAPFYYSTVSAFSTIPYSGTSMGFWNCWITSSVGSCRSLVNVRISGLGSPITFGVETGYYYLQPGTGNPPGFSTTPAPPNVPTLVSIGVTLSGTAMTVTLYLNGQAQFSKPYYDSMGAGSVASLPTNANKTPSMVTLQSGDGITSAVSFFSHLSHTATLPLEAYAGATTEANRLTLIAATAPEISLAALPADLSPAMLGAVGGATTTLTSFTDVMKTEQGSIYTATTGTLLAPVQTVNVRARQRPSAVSYSFDASNDLSGIVPFVRDITNMVSTVAVNGPATSWLVNDASVVGRAGSSSAVEACLNLYGSDLAQFGQDRINRGKNVNLRVTSVTVDALTTRTDRSAALLAMIPGDRIRITGLPTASLGFTTWDGWLLGATELHTVTTHTFTLYLQPCLPTTAVFDTDLFAAGISLSLTAGITNSATTMSVSTTGALLETSVFPYTLLIDSEPVIVTACTSASPQVATITRSGGAVAVAHTTTATIEVSPVSLYAF